MSRKVIPFIILLLMAALVIVLRRCQNNKPVTETKNEKRSTTKNNPAELKRDRGFDRRVSFIEYTQHAICRMDCRKISQADIKDIMQNGEINYAKTEVNDKPCPTYAVQGYTNDKEHLRVIFAQCNEKTKVVTCYNLDEEFECHCPGDEKKN